MKILSLDCSSKSTGVALFKDKELLYYDCITASSTDLIKRINKMVENIEKIIIENKDIDKIIMEEVIPSTGKNIKTWKALIYLQASLMILFHNKYPSISVELIYPNSWRSKIGISTGRGITRDQLKEQDINFVKEHYNITVNDDIADAICIGHSNINTSFVQ